MVRELRRRKKDERKRERDSRVQAIPGGEEIPGEEAGELGADSLAGLAGERSSA